MEEKLIKEVIDLGNLIGEKIEELVKLNIEKVTLDKELKEHEGLDQVDEFQDLVTVTSNLIQNLEHMSYFYKERLQAVTNTITSIKDFKNIEYREDLSNNTYYLHTVVDMLMSGIIDMDILLKDGLPEDSTWYTEYFNIIDKVILLIEKIRTLYTEVNVEIVKSTIGSIEVGFCIVMSNNLLVDNNIRSLSSSIRSSFNNRLITLKDKVIELLKRNDIDSSVWFK